MHIPKAAHPPCATKQTPRTSYASLRSHPVEQTLTWNRTAPTRAPWKKRKAQSHRNDTLPQFTCCSSPRVPETSVDENALTTKLQKRSPCHQNNTVDS